MGVIILHFVRGLYQKQSLLILFFFITGVFICTAFAGTRVITEGGVECYPKNFVFLAGHPVLSEQGLHDSVVGRTCSFDGQTESAGIILVGRVEDWEGAG